MRALRLAFLLALTPTLAVAQSVCAQTPFEGSCDGAVVRWCEAGEPRSIDCAGHDACCGWSTASLGGSYGCVPCGACTSACEPGQRGCSVEATHAWTCTAREGACNDRAWERCEQGCQNGACGEPGQNSDPCPDPCEVGEVGCLDEARAFTCEIPQTGACPRKTATVCGDGEGCFEGACQPLVASAEPAGSSGCSAAPGLLGLPLAALVALLATLARRRRN